jgi:hypothetical protein
MSRAGQDASKDFDFHTRQGKNVWKRMQVGRVAQCAEKTQNDGDCTIS